ncbi:histidine phosphatase family protein [Candidatus Kaiserbacteria bacterium]|nr:histidine phosphatase family protein [Candidatus Kaiserbacteria bacterium]
MEKPEGESHESREHAPAIYATVYLVRHGTTNYGEERGSPEVVEHDLTEEGVKSLQRLAEQINDEIEPNDAVYVMSSPRVRAENSAQVLTEALEAKGHTVEYLKGAKNSTRNWKLYRDEEDKTDKNERRDIYDRRGDGTDAEIEAAYKRDMDAAFGQVLEAGPDLYLGWLRGEEIPFAENSEEYKKKIKVFLLRLADIARKRGEAALDERGAAPNEKVIITTHGEWLDSALKIFFNKEITSLADGVQKGEALKMEIFPDSVRFTFHDETIVLDA